MNSYVEHHVKRFYTAFNNGEFDQDDVAFFIILIREYSKPRGILREFGDYIAHPNKDRGTLSNNIGIYEEPVIEYIAQSLEKSDHKREPIFEGIGTHEALRLELTDIFRSVGIEDSRIDCNGHRYREFIFCLIFLLSTFELRYRGQDLRFYVEYSHSLTLYADLKSNAHRGINLKLPILLLNNVWPDCPISLGAFHSRELVNCIAKRFNQGYLGAIEFSKDDGTKFLDVEKFKRGELWGLSYEA